MDNKKSMADLILEKAELRKKYESLFPEYEEKIFLYPDWWFELNDYEFKIRMLKKGIEEKKPIKKLNEIQNMSYDSNGNISY